MLLPARPILLSPAATESVQQGSNRESTTASADGTAEEKKCDPSDPSPGAPPTTATTKKAFLGHHGGAGGSLPPPRRWLAERLLPPLLRRAAAAAGAGGGGTAGNTPAAKTAAAPAASAAAAAAPAGAAAAGGGPAGGSHQSSCSPPPLSEPSPAMPPGGAHSSSPMSHPFVSPPLPLYFIHRNLGCGLNPHALRIQNGPQTESERGHNHALDTSACPQKHRAFAPEELLLLGRREGCERVRPVVAAAPRALGDGDDEPPNELPPYPPFLQPSGARERRGVVWRHRVVQRTAGRSEPAKCCAEPARACQLGSTATSAMSATNWPSLIARASPTSFGRAGCPGADAAPSVVNAPTTCVWGYVRPLGETIFPLGSRIRTNRTSGCAAASRSPHRVAVLERQLNLLQRCATDDARLLPKLAHLRRHGRIRERTGAARTTTTFLEASTGRHQSHLSSLVGSVLNDAED